MQFTLKIDLDPDTLNFLYNNGMWLRIFNGEKTSAVAINTVWYTTNEFETEFSVSWSDDFNGFILPNQNLEKGTIITPNKLFPMQQNYVLSINEAGIVAVSTNGGNAGAFTFYNNSDDIMIYGVSQTINKVSQAYTLGKLTGNGTDVLSPIPVILIVFETGQSVAGTVVEKTLNSSLLINPVATTMEVSYNYKNSWNTNGAANMLVFKESVIITDKLREQYVSYYR